MREAERLWQAGRESEAAERLTVAQKLDETHPRIYQLRAQMARVAGRERLELQAWKRLVEVSRAEPPLRRQAKERIAELYRLLDGNRPEWEYRLPSPPPPTPDIDALAAGVWRLQLKPPLPSSRGQTGELHFVVPRERSDWWLVGCVDTRGLAVRASLQRKEREGWQTVWHFPTPEPQRFPRLECRLPSGEYRLRIEHDSTHDGVEGAFHVAVSLSLSREKPAPLAQQWTYRLHQDGSAEVEVTVSGAATLPVPFTAEGLQVEGARYSLLPPVYEYLSQLELRHAQVLLLQPTGEQATARFRWPDAAYNVPMTRHASEYRERFHFRSLSPLGTLPEGTEVSVHLPEGTGEITTLSPPPQSRDGSSLHFRLMANQVVTLHARNPEMNTRWLTATYRRLTLYIPDTPFYRRWLPEYLALLMRLYDRQQRMERGREPEEMRLLALPLPVTLPDGGTAEWGGVQGEAWLTCTERITPYRLRYTAEDNVEAQAIRRMFGQGAIRAIRW
ncbi:MAG: hypothetical protein NZ520_02775 [bacterium]|nr:hypothetical protein [bacterium]